MDSRMCAAAHQLLQCGVAALKRLLEDISSPIPVYECVRPDPPQPPLAWRPRESFHGKELNTIITGHNQVFRKGEQEPKSVSYHTTISL